MAIKYQENLKFYSSLTIENQDRLFEEIYTNIQRYKSLIDLLMRHDKEFAEKEGEVFNNYLKLFQHFYGGSTDEDEYQTPVDQDLQQNNPSIDSEIPPTPIP